TEDVTKEERLGQSLNNVRVAQVLPGDGEVLSAVLVVHEHGHAGATQDATSIGNDGEKEEHGHAGKDARCHQLAQRVNAEGAHRVNLLGHHHGAELAGHG